MRYFLIKTIYLFSLLCIFNHLNAEPPTIRSLIAYLEEGSSFRSLESFYYHFDNPTNRYGFSERLKKILFTSFPPVFKETEGYRDADCLTPLAVEIYTSLFDQCLQGKLFNTQACFSLKLGGFNFILQRNLSNQEAISKIQENFLKLSLPKDLFMVELLRIISTTEYKYLSQNRVINTLKDILDNHSDSIDHVVNEIATPFYESNGYNRDLSYLCRIISEIIEYYGYENETYNEFSRNQPSFLWGLSS